MGDIQRHQAIRPGFDPYGAEVGTLPVRSGIVDVYIIRRIRSGGIGWEFMQLVPNTDPPQREWEANSIRMPVVGSVREGELAADAALREVHAQTRLHSSDSAFEGMWSVATVHPFFIEALNCIVMPARFVVRVPVGWEPVLTPRHVKCFWPSVDYTVHTQHPASQERAFHYWPGQWATVQDVMGAWDRGNGLERGRTSYPLLHVDVPST